MSSDARPWTLTGLSVLVGAAGGFTAVLLLALIHLVTNVAYFGQLSLVAKEPALNQLGVAAVLVPVAGALLIGVMARWGSEAIRGHGIPEVMDRILHAESRIPARLIVLKPASAAIAIGTGGPFGAEGPIIATGAALGSLLGQLIHVTADERKILLAAGAAAGMAATFGSPVAAVLLAVELLLFEYRAASVIPVGIAACAATVVRLAFFGSAPVFPMPEVHEPTGTALVVYAVLGGVVGVISAGITKVVYLIEEGFEHLPLHWMWWPAVGAVVVGLLGLLEPRILGVGYGNITAALGGKVALWSLTGLVIFKFIGWAVYLGSGTSGGTLAPLFTFGSGLGAIAGGLLALHFPELGIDPPVAALVGMAAMFAGASRALLASVVFAFETTHQPLGLLPLLAGCAVAYLMSRSLMRNSIMTEKLVRRGVVVPDEYSADFLAGVSVARAMITPVIVLSSDESSVSASQRLQLPGNPGHQGFPVVDSTGALCGVITRRDLAAAQGGQTVGDLIRRAPVFLRGDQSLRDAADLMVRENVGRLPVVSVDGRQAVLGIITRSDLLRAHASRLRSAEQRQPALFPGLRNERPGPT